MERNKDYGICEEFLDAIKEIGKGEKDVEELRDCIEKVGIIKDSTRGTSIRVVGVHDGKILAQYGKNNPDGSYCATVVYGEDVYDYTSDGEFLVNGEIEKDCDVKKEFLEYMGLEEECDIESL